MITFRVVHKPTNNHARCLYRVVEQTTGGEIEWINQYLDYETLRRWPTQLCEPTRTHCCTFSGGGRVFITPMRSPKMRSPNRHCSTMYDSSPARNAS